MAAREEAGRFFLLELPFFFKLPLLGVVPFFFLEGGDGDGDGIDEGAAFPTSLLLLLPLPAPSVVGTAGAHAVG